ncbi:16S rRNA pseudouridine(516) synthase [Variovorax sp. PCZ-1]|uniref:16S rRNA pseudouridine(516) synthase n=1 Tax=Variovorax sp. PCZ-1 TaxID=2835533 RepID=UPI001BD101E0|nr:16S rRNA pseudouridine(516) synthase [Variovorax sp. PCZ-1]MBS7806570.1 16S rRNA pseudouridine(516) synthase [Variovorax sp. PCZ-1]
MRLDDLLFSQGFGTRRVCAGLIQQGFIKGFEQFAGAEPAQSATEIIVTDGMPFSVQGKAWEYHERAYLMLHKPAGYECSHRPGAWPSAYSLLPAPLRQRPTKGVVQGVQAIGRLDQDTTGLLLLTDDGQFLHKMSSPKHHVPKVYQITTDREVDTKQIEKLLAGVVLNDDPKPVKAAAAEQTGEKTLDMTLTEGKYHQVKRMIAAVGNHVVALHRSQIGNLVLNEDLPSGQWRWLSASELESLSKKC